MNLRHYKLQPLIILILLANIAFSYLIDYLTGNFITNSQLLKVVDLLQFTSIPSLIFFILFLLENYLWKLPIFKLFVDSPDLNGRYKGQLISNHGVEGVVKDCVIEIKQSASKIAIATFFKDEESEDSSESYSISEDIRKGNDGFYYLSFTYSNSPRMLAKGLDKHRGLCELKSIPKGKALIGSYYNERGLKGEINVNFKSKKRLGKF